MRVYYWILIEYYNIVASMKSSGTACAGYWSNSDRPVEVSMLHPISRDTNSSVRGQFGTRVIFQI